MEQKKYRLAPGSQVREEDFGLLFYTKKGPRLYFLNCGTALAPYFFTGRMDLVRWFELQSAGDDTPVTIPARLGKALDQLVQKGVIVEC